MWVFYLHFLFADSTSFFCFSSFLVSFHFKLLEHLRTEVSEMWGVLNNVLALRGQCTSWLLRVEDIRGLGGVLGGVDEELYLLEISLCMEFCGGIINPFTTGNTPVCVWTMLYQGNISSRFSSNSEASASELLENHEDMFPPNISKLVVNKWL